MFYKEFLMGSNLLILIATFFLSVFWPLTLSADPEASSADQSAGQAFYNQQCSSCHGKKAEGNKALASPALAGQQSTYLLRQLQNFKTGKRGTDSKDIYGQQMLAIMANIESEAELKNVSAYLQALPISKIEIDESGDGDPANGYKYYQGSCGSCHGSKAEGSSVFNAPRLSNQSYTYLSRQYQYFLEGTRGTHKKDRYGRQMKMIAGTLQDEQTVKDVLTFINSLSEEK